MCPRRSANRALYAYFLKCITPARLRETKHGQRKSQQQERKLYDAPRPINGSRQLRQQTCGNELLQAPIPATLCAHKERNQEWGQQQAPKPFWYAKGHGIANCHLPTADCLTGRQLDVERWAPATP